MPKLQLASYAISVDDRGFLTDTVFEGALGFVAKIEARDGTPRALKIPRLLADTDRENHYVCSLTEHEVTNAALLVSRPGLTSLDFGGQSLLRSLPYVSGRQEAIVVQFSKELKPRFCLVSAELAEKRLVLTPHLKDLADWLTFDVWQEAIKLCQGGGGAVLTETVVLRRKAQDAANTATEAFLLVQQQVGREQTGLAEDTWYLGLSSPVYFWRGGTLEYAVRKEKRGRWIWSDHCALCGQLANGLDSLYQEKFVHGDLRPANIMYNESPGKASDYSLVDYASYSGLAGALENPAGPSDSGQTLVGVAVAEARQSPFYPVERRVGRERENCDTVAIRRTNGLWNIHVGYRSDMFNESSEQLSAATQEQMKLVVAEQRQLGSSEWKRGDRIRVRDFVFQVDGWKGGPTGFSMVSKAAWLVHNNRILVPLDPDAFEGKDRVLSVSRTFPIWQWSMATDFFALGVTLMYSLFFAHEPAVSDNEEAIKLDNEFEAMIAVISTVQYAGVILPNVAAVSRLLRSIWTDAEFEDRNVFTPRKVAALQLTDAAGDVSWDGEPGDRPCAEELDLKDNQCLLGRTWAIAMSVVQTTPGAQRVLKALDQNLAVFVCLIDLAMQLMHRREDLADKLREPMPWMCEDRTTAPDSDKAQKLIGFINTTVVGLQQTFVNAKEFKCPESEVLGYSSRNETLLRIQVRELESKVDDTRKAMDAARDVMAGAKVVMDGLKYKNQDVKRVLRDLDSTLQGLDARTVHEPETSASR